MADAVKTNVYLSDEFVAFSEKIKAIQTAKKTKKDEMKKVFDSFQAELKKLDDDAKKETDVWEAFVAKQNVPVASVAVKK